MYPIYLYVPRVFLIIGLSIPPMLRLTLVIKSAKLDILG